MQASSSDMCEEHRSYNLQADRRACANALIRWRASSATSAIVSGTRKFNRRRQSTSLAKLDALLVEVRAQSTMRDLQQRPVRRPEARLLVQVSSH